MNRLFLKKNGQSTLEYMIVWTAIIGAILVAATRFLEPTVENTVEIACGKITTEVERLVSEIGR